MTINKTTNTFERKTGSIRILSDEKFRISTGELIEVVTETSVGRYGGLTLEAEANFITPGNAAIIAEDDDKLYSSFLASKCKPLKSRPAPRSTMRGQATPLHLPAAL